MLGSENTYSWTEGGSSSSETPWFARPVTASKTAGFVSLSLDGSGGGGADSIECSMSPCSKTTIVIKSQGEERVVGEPFLPKGM